MNTLQKPTTLLVCLAFLFQMLSPAMAAQQASQGNAADLVKNADRAVAYVVKSARDSKDQALSMDNKEAEPFWQAVKKLNEAVDKIERGLTLKDETFFTAIATATSAVEEVKITFGMSGAKDSAVKKGIEKVDTSISLLRENYSKEAARLKQGGDLSDKEKQQLEEIKDKQSELQRKLTELEGQVGKNETLIKGIREAREKSHEVSNCNNDLAGFLFAMTAINMINGWIWGWHWWWGPFGGWWPGFSVGFVDVYIDTIYVIDYDWLIVDDMIETEIYDTVVDDEIMNDLEAHEAEAFIEDAEVGLTAEEFHDFGTEELQYEGTMDIIELDDFAEPGVGEFQDFDAFPEVFD